MPSSRHRSTKRSVRRNHRPKKSAYLIATLIMASVIAAGAWLFSEIHNNKPAEVWYNVRSKETRLVNLPQDDAPHENYIEWWYYNGHLHTQSGKTFSFHYVVFLVTALHKHAIAHVSFVDHQTGQHFTEQVRTGGGLSTDSGKGFRFGFSDWVMSGFDGKDRLKVSTDDFSFSLSLTDKSGPVLQGGDGLIDMGDAGTSYYYSRPRMAVSGYLQRKGTREHLTGVAWFDHQWGDFYSTYRGWDWFALQLDDDSDIMLYLIYDQVGNPVIYAGTLSEPGKSEDLTADEFKVTATGNWTSDATGITYPMGWRVQIPSKRIDLNVNPVITDSEFDGRTTIYKSYWEGPVKVQGTHIGIGYVELSRHPNLKPEKPKT